MSERNPNRDGDEGKLPPVLRFLQDREAFVRRFVLAEVLGPPRAMGNRRHHPRAVKNPPTREP